MKVSTFTASFSLLAAVAWADPLYVNRTVCTHSNVPTPQIVDVFYETTGPVPCYVRYTKAGATSAIGAAPNRRREMRVCGTENDPKPGGGRVQLHDVVESDAGTGGLFALAG